MFHPCLPGDLAAMRFRLHYRQHHTVEVMLDHDRLVVSGWRGLIPPTRLVVRGEEYRVDPGGAVEIPLVRR
jgi:hypothetical protein